MSSARIIESISKQLDQYRIESRPKESKQIELNVRYLAIPSPTNKQMFTYTQVIAAQSFQKSNDPCICNLVNKKDLHKTLNKISKLK